MTTAVQVQYRRGASSQIASFTGAQGELVVDTTNNRVVVQDGATAGGWPAARLADLPIVSRTSVSDAAYTVLNTDRNIAYTALTAARTVSLPAAASFPVGIRLTVIDESGAASGTLAITISAAGTDKIDGAANTVITSAYGYVAIETNGSSKWTTVDQSASSLIAVGIGTAADPGNPLSVTANNALLNALTTGAGGTGDFRIKMNKAASANTASTQYQDGFTTHAEVGLCGDDNFHFKVSPNGSTWNNGIVIDNATGAVTFGNARTAVSDAGYTALSTDRLIAYTALTAARTVVLPAASAFPAGMALVIVDESGACSPTNTIALARAGTDTINGATSASISSAYGWCALESNGSSKWIIIAQPGSGGGGSGTVSSGTAGQIGYYASSGSAISGDSSLTISTNALTLAANGIGSTSTDGFELSNTTAAASGAQQWSPRLHFIGQGWKTNAVAASQTVDFIQELQTIQGTASPNGNLVWSAQVNSGGYTAQATLTSGGVFNIAAALTTPLVGPASDSTTAFKITKANLSTAVMTFDTTNARVGINKTPGAYDLDVNNNVNVGGSLAFGSLSATSLAASTSTITGLTNNSSPVAASDYVPFYSSANGAINKISVSNLASSASAGGLINKFRNGTMDMWQRGTGSMTITTSGAYAADGWIVVPTGASVTAQQTSGRLLTVNSLKVTGASSVSDVIVKQRIESYLAAPLSSQVVTVQAQVYNGTGSSITPKLTVKHAASADNWSSPTTDVSAASFQSCANSSWTQIAYTFTASSASANGLEISFDFGNNFGSGSNYVSLTECDIRVTPGYTAGAATGNPPPPELRPICEELKFCERYFCTSVAFNTAAHNVGAVDRYAGFSWSTSGIDTQRISFPSRMCAVPTIAFFSPNVGTPSNGLWQLYDGVSAWQGCTSMSVQTGTDSGFVAELSGLSVATKSAYIVYGTWTASAEL